MPGKVVLELELLLEFQARARAVPSAVIFS